ncbi:MAG: ABC-type transport auxiliary lipoprotein family protein [Geminicoccaceae bacterium]
MMFPLRAGRTAALAACLLVGGCAAALELATREPPQLFELTPKSTFPNHSPEIMARLSVEVPSATAGLNTARIALRPAPTTLEYYGGASWIDVLPIMVQTLLIESFDNAGGIDVLGREMVGVRADYALLTHIREFQAEYRSSAAAPTVHVRLQARLIRLPRRTSLAATSAEASVPAENTSLQAIVRAFDEAFGKVQKRIVEWTAQQIAAQQAPTL